MFYRLRRLIIALFVAGWGGLGWYFYEHPRLTEPIVTGTGWAEDHARILLHWWGDRKKIAGEMDGVVTRVFNGSTFQVLDPTGRRYNFGLAGVQAPETYYVQPRTGVHVGEECRQFLNDLILSNEVRVVLTRLTPSRTGLGIVFVGGTNVNAALVKRGLAQLNPAARPTLPTSSLIALEQAQAAAQRAQVGIWKDTLPSAD